MFSIDVMFEGPEIVLRAAAHGREETSTLYGPPASNRQGLVLPDGCIVRGVADPVLEDIAQIPAFLARAMCR